MNPTPSSSSRSGNQRDQLDELLRQLTFERYAKPVRQAIYDADTFSVTAAMGQAQAMTELLAEHEHETAAALLRVVA